MPSLSDFNTNSNDKNTKIYTKENLGYVDGYAKYTSKSGAHWGPGVQETKKIEKSGYDSDKRDGVRENWLYDKQSNIFKKIIKGYNNNLSTKSDEYEDPTFLIFDIEIDTDDSPLFNPKYGNNDFTLNRFINEYYENIPEINERKTANTDKFGMFDEFRKQFTKIFPTSSPNSLDYPESGSKRHYIESIGGLDLLNKKIVNYPDDAISITLSDDITLLTQYLSELYNNLIFSYDTQRQLIPNNLLRFNLRILVSDFRNMKIKFNDSANNTEEYKDIINSNVSKMLYILHDCELNFFETKSFGDELIRGGFGSSKPNTPAKNTFKINYKSVSKIMAPLLIDNSIIIDLREREPLNKDNYKNKYNNGVSDDVIITKNGKKKNKYLNKFKDAIKREVTDVRNILVNQLKSEVGDLAAKANDWLYSKVGFTGIKLNVYQETPKQKLGQINVKLTNYLDKKIGNLLDTNDNSNDATLTEREGNVYKNEQSRNIKQPLSTKDDVYYDLNETNGIHNPIHNEKYPSGTIQPKGGYNEKYPSGDLHVDGIYNEKYPIGSIQPDGTYNEKYPSGDLHVDGIYNEKYPNGIVQPKGGYNEKYPSGDLHVDGTYNEKYPSGIVQSKGGYNEKYPSGDLHPDVIYNSKKPNGNVYKKYI